MAAEIPIQAILSELELIKREKGVVTKEKNSVYKRWKDLDNREKELNDKVKIYLREKKQPGVKYQGIAVVSETVEKKKTKKKEEAEKDIMGVFQHYGIDGNAARKIYAEIKEAGKDIVKEDHIKFISLAQK